MRIQIKANGLLIEDFDMVQMLQSRALYSGLQYPLYPEGTLLEISASNDSMTIVDRETIQEATDED